MWVGPTKSQGSLEVGEGVRVGQQWALDSVSLVLKLEKGNRELRSVAASGSCE